MSEKLETFVAWFSKVGRGVPQKPQVDRDGKPLYIKKDSDGKASTTDKKEAELIPVLDDDGKPTDKTVPSRLMGNEQYSTKQFRLVPYTETVEEAQTDEAGNPILDEDGEPVVETIEKPKVEVLMESIMEAVSGDVEFAAEAFTIGINRKLKEIASGGDVWLRQARRLIKESPNQFGSWDEEVLAGFLKNAKPPTD